MLNTTHYERNANQNYNEVSLYMGQNGNHQKIYKQGGGNVNWYSHYAEQYGYSLKKKKN